MTIPFDDSTSIPMSENKKIGFENRMTSPTNTSTIAMRMPQTENFSMNTPHAGPSHRPWSYLAGNSQNVQTQRSEIPEHHVQYAEELSEQRHAQTKARTKRIKIGTCICIIFVIFFGTIVAAIISMITRGRIW